MDAFAAVLNNPFSFAASVIFAYMVAVYLLALYLENNSIVDTAWGIGFILASISTWLCFGTPLLGGLIVVLILVWGIRLSTHVFIRNHKKGVEDFRYAKWRHEWKWVRTRSFFQVFMLQGVILYFIVLPAVFATSQQASFGLTTLIGLLVWLVGFFFESVGDKQLTTFIANPKNIGTIIQTGLWKYTRHPNYFGEATMWYGIWLLALPAIIPFGIFAVVGTFLASPVWITYMLLKISGVPMLEEAMAQKPGWADYAAKTSMFIPLPPKK